MAILNELPNEVVDAPYGIVHRLVGISEARVLTVIHSSQSFPAEL